MQRTDREYKQQVLDQLSPSFCGAKWYNATIWLGSGMTTSCHHPPAHKIDEQEIKFFPSRIHNTKEKKQDREQMVNGDRPPGCEYCWKIEDASPDNISDRVYKSKIYSDEELHNAKNTFTQNNDYNLRTLEISFDRTCQFACSYCNPAFSSTWVKDIARRGSYTNLISDGRNHFTHIHDSAQLFKFGDQNPYTDAFFKWWETDLHASLEELRITGGEPLMSGYTWKLLTWFKENPQKSKTRLAINSNLGMETSKIQELLDAAEGIELDIYTSNEAMTQQAEYIRDGLVWQQWVDNMELLIKSKRIRSLHVMNTINALCLESLPEFLTFLLEWKSKWGKDFPNFTLNILRFPSFQSPLVLPKEIREHHADKLHQWLSSFGNHSQLHEHEQNHIFRLIDYLNKVETPHSETFERPKLLNDFKQFYTQYDQRRQKNFCETFPNLADWFNSL